ncbi:pca1 [Symbiodinium necroappetens]|uniref:Pca1 protein n=1 Tax=Symbiodinium necroappetens TaxID=1628268 RepID=A0A813BBU0_9DINO|nr:pca1 [Symbiodinium necroappetens]
MELLRCVAEICCGESPQKPRPLVQPGPGVTGAPAPPSQVALTGRRRSLLVGINYFGTQNELHGCVSDVQRMLPLLDKLGFPSDAESRRVLVDAPDWPQHLHPTLANMRQGIAWLTSDAQPGDSLLFHYSGHGGRMPRSDGRSEWHETLCPVDMDAEGMLLDSELFETLVRPLPSGCRLTCILDSCHSDGVLDLPFIFVGTQENLASALAGEAAQMVMSKNWLQDWQAWQESDDPAMLLSDAASMGMDLWSLWGKYSETREANEQGFRTDEAENEGVAVGEVVAFTGCASEQTSADVGDVGAQFQLQPTLGAANAGGHLLLEGAGRAGGALTSAFIEAMQTQGEETYVQLLEHLRQRLDSAGFSQVPQLASSLVLDLNTPFSVDKITPPPQPGQMPSKSMDRDMPGYGGYGCTDQNQGSVFSDMLTGVQNMLMAEEATELMEEAGSRASSGRNRIFYKPVS